MKYGHKYRLAEPFQYLEPNLVFFAPYSGNAPYQTNFLGSPHSMKGHVGTPTGGVIYRPGKPRYDGLTSKAASFGRAATNMWVNPSIETNTTGYAALLAAVLTRVAGISEIGAYSLQTTTPGVAAGEGWQTPTGVLGIAVVAAQNYTFSLYLQGSGTVTQRITWYTAAGAFISNSDQTVTIQTAFSRNCLTATAPALSAFAAMSIITNAIQAITFYADAIQFENFNYATPYLDGSMGTGYAWTGAAHASTSTRAAAYINYNNLTTLNNFVNKGTFSFWFQTPNIKRSGNHYALNITSAVTGNIYANLSMGVTTDRFIISWGATTLTLPEGLLSYGAYMHLAVSYDGAYIKAYLNGTLIATGLSINNWSGALAAFVAGDNAAATANFDGQIDDFLLFDRVLTEGEIKEIHHYGYSIGAYESDTCNFDPVFVVNSHNKANITHAYIRSNAGVWSNNLMTEPLPFLLLPAAPVIGDAIYFGCEAWSVTGAPLDSGWFSNVIFNILAGTGITSVWEYWNGGAWAGLVNARDGTNGLKNDGKNGISFEPLNNWAPVLLSTAIAGAPASAPVGYWIRFRITAITTSPLQLDYYPFSNTWPYFDICDDSIEGDYEALLKINEQNVWFSNTQSIIVGNRSLERGENFACYLNCSDEQNKDFVSVGLVSASAAFATSNLSASQRVITYAPGGVVINEDVFYIRVMNQYYPGTYRLILSARASIDSIANFRIELEPYITGYGTSPIAYSQWRNILLGGTQRYIDFGQITIPEDIGREPTVNGFNLVVHVDKDDLVNATWTFFNILLLPNDELSLEAFDDNVNPTTYISSCTTFDYLYMDSAEDQKQTVNSESWSSTAKKGNYRSITRGAISAPPRHPLRFWHKMLENHNLASSYTDGRLYHLMKVLLYDAERYIGLRGDR